MPIIHLQISISAHVKQSLTQFHRLAIASWPISLSSPGPMDSSMLTSPSFSRPSLWVTWPQNPIASASSIRLHYSPAPPPLSKLINTSHSSMVEPSTPPVCCSVQWTPASFLSSRNSSWTSLSGTSLFPRQSPFG